MKPYGPRLRHGHYVGGVESSTHAIWRGMLSRCCNAQSKDYSRYGAVGVRVCRRWRVFDNFLADMGERPSGLQLDRWPNPHGDYKPTNCRWTTQSDNQKNKRNTRRYKYRGRSLTPSELAAVLGISRPLMSYRLRRGDYANARV